MPSSRVEQALRALAIVVEHRLHVGRPIADDLQDFGGGGLPLQRLLVSLNSRAFSIAITAWSAKVCSSAISLSAEGAGSRGAR